MLAILVKYNMSNKLVSISNLVTILEWIPDKILPQGFSFNVLKLLLIPKLPDLNEYGIFERQQKKLFLDFAIKIKVVSLEMEKIYLRKTFKNTVNTIQKYLPS